MVPFLDIHVFVWDHSWNDSVLEFPKLRTYALYQDVYHDGKYVKELFSKRQGSV